MESKDWPLYCVIFVDYVQDCEIWYADKTLNVPDNCVRSPRGEATSRLFRRCEFFELCMADMGVKLGR